MQLKASIKTGTHLKIYRRKRDGLTVARKVNGSQGY